MKELLFAAIDLEGRPCTVVGGGHVAERKIKRLVKCGAAVSAVAPEFTDTLSAMAIDGTISLDKRCYEKGDLSGAFLAVIATDDDIANRAALNEAKELGILTNAAFDKDHGDIFFTATRAVGDFVISAIGDDLSPKSSLDLLDEIESILKKREDDET